MSRARLQSTPVAAAAGQKVTVQPCRVLLEKRLTSLRLRKQIFVLAVISLYRRNFITQSTLIRCASGFFYH